VISLEHCKPGRRSNHIVRDRLLSEQGYVILRLWRREAERDLHSALHLIRAVLDDLAAAGPAKGCAGTPVTAIDGRFPG
jgi:very-short-patch-repair endonuclease